MLAQRNGPMPMCNCGPHCLESNAHRAKPKRSTIWDCQTPGWRKKGRPNAPPMPCFSSNKAPTSPAASSNWPARMQKPSASSFSCNSPSVNLVSSYGLCTPQVLLWVLALQSYDGSDGSFVILLQGL